VSNLRKKLDAAQPEAEPIIETMRGRGYRLAPVFPPDQEPGAQLNPAARSIAEPGK
jgi:DNA-binding winged helix-turn-helix (wHTH) protein